MIPSSKFYVFGEFEMLFFKICFTFFINWEKPTKNKEKHDNLRKINNKID